MVINGGSRGEGDLARDLRCIVADERAALIDLQGVVSEFLPGAIEEMLAVGSGTRSSKPLYHVSIETAPAEDLTRDQQAHAIAALERRLGLTDHARAVVECHTGDQNRLHVLWSRVDIETMTVVPDSWNYRAHKDAARQLQRDFGHACPPPKARRG